MARSQTKSQGHARRRALVGNLATFFVIHLLADGVIPRQLERGDGKDFLVLGLICGAGIAGMTQFRNEALASASAAVAATGAIRISHGITNRATRQHTVDANGNWVSPNGNLQSISALPPLSTPRRTPTPSAAAPHQR